MPSRFTRFLIISTLNLLLFSCDFFDQENENLEKQWVYIELITESKSDTTEYFYFGQINKSILNKIESDKIENAHFRLSNIRYWNDDHQLELYEDKKLVGELIFRLKDIEEVTLYKDDPINLFDDDELHESIRNL